MNCFECIFFVRKQILLTSLGTGSEESSRQVADAEVVEYNHGLGGRTSFHLGGDNHHTNNVLDFHSYSCRSAVCSISYCVKNRDGTDIVHY
jgi:hypothetical protein